MHQEAAVREFGTGAHVLTRALLTYWTQLTLL